MRQGTHPQIKLLFILISFFAFGCKPIAPTYTKENFVPSIQKICKEEFGINDVKVWLIGETAWIYAPQNKLIDKDLKFDKKITERINKVALSVSRVLLSMKPRPKFYVIVASDIKDLGADLINVGNVDDIVRYQFEFISRGEFGKRNVYDAYLSPSALSDTEGKHINPYDIKMEDFLSLQIVQRISLKFKEDRMEIKSLECFFKDGTFNLQYEKVDAEKNANFNVNKEILKIVFLALKNYSFNDYSFVKISNLESGERTILGRNALEQDFSSN
ncbi:MAG: hypothetical protein Q8L26_05130 [Candidatus Omnitrophota bacterium]|nr:hypothetical protein [Candidatus Omnitrophota bacterium]